MLRIADSHNLVAISRDEHHILQAHTAPARNVDAWLVADDAIRRQLLDLGHLGVGFRRLHAQLRRDGQLVDRQPNAMPQAVEVLLAVARLVMTSREAASTSRPRRTPSCNALKPASCACAYDSVQLGQLRVRLADAECARRVGAVAIHPAAEVDEQRLTRPHGPVGGDGVWLRAAGATGDDGGEARAAGAQFDHVLLQQGGDLALGHTHLDLGQQLLERIIGDIGGAAHRGDFRLVFDGAHQLDQII